MQRLSALYLWHLLLSVVGQSTQAVERQPSGCGLHSGDCTVFVRVRPRSPSSVCYFSGDDSHGGRSTNFFRRQVAGIPIAPRVGWAPHHTHPNGPANRSISRLSRTRSQVEWFCFPQGLFLLSSASQPAPHVSSFVRFTSGVRSYGLCLTFYRQVDVSEEPHPFVTDAAASRGMRRSRGGAGGAGRGVRMGGGLF